MGLYSSGRPACRLPMIVLGATLAVQLHARGLRSMSQGTIAMGAPAALPAAAMQPPWLNTSALPQQLPQPLHRPPVTFPGLLPTGGTKDPAVLAGIPPLLAPIRCKMLPDQPYNSSQPGLLEMTGMPTAFTTAKAARLQAQQAARQQQRQQQQQQQQQQVAGFLSGSGWRTSTAVPVQYVDILAQHNSYRAKHQAPALLWDQPLADAAASFAGSCVFDHDAASAAGENLYASSATADPATALRNAATLWYNEVSLYDFNDPGYSSATGHFTQVVWKGSSSLGCAVQLCPGGITNTPFTAGTLVICRYTPPGNVLGRFEEDVLPVPQAPAPPAEAPPAGPAPEPATLEGGHNFVSPGCLVAVGDAFWLCIQHDGNVVLFHNKQPIWASNSAGKSAFRPFKLTMQRDGNLVASDNLRQNVWMSGTAGHGSGPYRLVVQADGNVVLFDGASTALWATNTGTGLAVLMQANRGSNP